MFAIIVIVVCTLIAAIFANVILISMGRGIHPYDHRWVATVKPIENPNNNKGLWYDPRIYYRITVTDKKTNCFHQVERGLDPRDEKNEKTWARALARESYLKVRKTIAANKEIEARKTRYSKEEFTL